MNRWPWKCGQCGRFIDHAVDWWAPYGGSQDVDPPDDEPICEKCYAKNIEIAKREPERIAAYGRGMWHKSNDVRIAKSILRHRARV